MTKDEKELWIGIKGLEKNPTLEIGPKSYKAFMTEIGYGNFNGMITLYSEPVAIADVFGYDKGQQDNIQIFGDDGLGYAYAFDLNKEDTVFELSPLEDGLRHTKLTFLEFMEETVF